MALAHRSSPFLCAALVACGGGGTSAIDPPPANSALAAKMAKCFELKPGSAYTMSDGSIVKTVTEDVDGVARVGYESQANQSVSERYVDVWEVQNAGVRFYGWNQYKPVDRLVQKVRFTDGYTVAFPTQIGQRQEMTFSRTDATGTQAATASWTLDSIEDLHLGGQTLKDSCKFTVVNRLGQGEESVWFTPGLGATRIIDTRSNKETALERIVSRT